MVQIKRQMTGDEGKHRALTSSQPRKYILRTPSRSHKIESTQNPHLQFLNREHFSHSDDHTVSENTSASLYAWQAVCVYVCVYTSDPGWCCVLCGRLASIRRALKGGEPPRVVRRRRGGSRAYSRLQLLSPRTHIVIHGLHFFFTSILM